MKPCSLYISLYVSLWSKSLFCPCLYKLCRNWKGSSKFLRILSHLGSESDFIPCICDLRLSAELEKKRRCYHFKGI